MSTDNLLFRGGDAILEAAILEAALCFSPDVKADCRCTIALGLEYSSGIADLIGDAGMKGSEVLLMDDRKLMRGAGTK